MFVDISHVPSLPNDQYPHERGSDHPALSIYRQRILQSNTRLRPISPSTRALSVRGHHRCWLDVFHTQRAVTQLMRGNVPASRPSA